MTGCIFAQTCSLLGIDFTHGSSSQGLAQNQALEKYVNHLYLNWTSNSIIDLSTGNMVESSNSKQQNSSIVFENVLILWRVPPKLKTIDIKDCMIKVFGLGSVIFVNHLDETTVFVQFKNSELVSKFISLKENIERKNDAISVLNPLWKIFGGGKTYAANYEVYKEICSFSMSKILFADQAEALVNTRLIRSKLGGGLSIPEVRSSDDVFCRDLSVDEIVDSFYVPEVEQIRTSHL